AATLHRDARLRVRAGRARPGPLGHRAQAALGLRHDGLAVALRGRRHPGRNAAHRDQRHRRVHRAHLRASPGPAALQRGRAPELRSDPGARRAAPDLARSGARAREGAAVRAGARARRRAGVSAVTTTGSEVSLKATADLALRLEQPFYADPETVRRCQDKDAMRAGYRAGGLAVPGFARCDRDGDALAFAHERGFPLVVKPARGWGQRGVARVENESEL